MRRYIAGVMQSEVGDNWFLERVIRQLHDRQVFRLTERLEQDQTATSPTSGHEKALEISDFPHVIRANRDIFFDLCSRNSANVAKHGGLPLTWMHEIADWRNVHAHQPPNDLRTNDVDRVLDAMIRVLTLCDKSAASQVQKLVSAPTRPNKIVVRNATRTNEQLVKAQVEREEAQRERALAQSEHEKARRKLAEARQFSDDALRTLKQVEQVRESTQQSAQRTKRQLTMVREQQRELNQERRLLEPQRAQANSKLQHYRDKFKRASTGNGWIHTTFLGDWRVTRWLGQVQGTIHACVFPPRRRVDGEWISSQQNPLVQKQVESEESAFVWLYEQDHTNVVGRRARQSITDYEERVKQPHTMEDEFDDDIPF